MSYLLYEWTWTLSFCASGARKNLGELDVKNSDILSSCACPDPSIASLQQDDRRIFRELNNSALKKGRWPERWDGYILLCIFAFCLFVNSARAQKVDVLPYNAPVVVAVTSLKSENGLSQLSTSLVREGYTLDFGTMNDRRFSTMAREINVAEDLEYNVQLKHTLVLQEGTPLATVHIETMWAYGDLKNPIDADPVALAEYKRKYVPVYSNRIRLYIEAFVSAFEYTLLTHPLNEKP